MLPGVAGTHPVPTSRPQACLSGAGFLIFMNSSDVDLICYTIFMSRIHDHYFYQYLTCPNWVYHEREDVRSLEALERRLLMDGLLPDYTRTLLSERGYDEVDEEDHEEAFARTVELMERGVPRILHGALVSGAWVSRPDVLERVEGRSRFGSYYYVACDVKRSRKLRRETEIVGVFHAELLALIQGVRPTQGYVMDPDGNVQSFLIEDTEGAYHLALLGMKETLAGATPREFLTSRCKQSPWFHVCKQTVESCDGLSRINRIWEEEITLLERGGYKKVSQIARARLETLQQHVPEMSTERLAFVWRQAKALVSGTHDVVGVIQVPQVDTEYYFDIEADPLRDVEYLFGVLEVEGGVETYHAHVARNPSEEGEAWKAFLEHMGRVPDAPIIHYGWYEVEVVRRLGQKYGTDQAVLEGVLARMVDLLAIIRPAVIFPLSFYSLKDLAAYVGFSWRNPEASGAGSILWYEDWLAFGDQEKLQSILEYNEDDVRATWTLAEWLRTQNTYETHVD